MPSVDNRKYEIGSRTSIGGARSRITVSRKKILYGRFIIHRNRLSLFVGVTRRLRNRFGGSIGGNSDMMVSFRLG